VANLGQIFELLGEKAKADPCDAAKGIVTEGQKNLKEAGADEIRDCLIGTSLTKVEHYAIVSYTGLIIGAQSMGNKEVDALLRQNLQQEEKTAKKLEQNAPKLLMKAMQAEA